MAAYHCCVPLCRNDSRYDPDHELSFHKFPTNSQQQKSWIVKIRRDLGKNFKLSCATRVCSAHFDVIDFVKKLSGVKRLRPGAVPSVFAWTKETPKRVGPQRRHLMEVNQASDEGASCSTITSPPPEQAETQTPCSSADHDYSSPTPAAADKLTEAQQEIERLQTALDRIQDKLFFLERFSNDPHLINFYTGFKDYSTLKSLFFALQPTARTMIRWTQMQRNYSNLDNIRISAFKDESLSLIDQFFMFLCRVRQGFPEQDLALRFCISQASVSRIIITWANYLYFMLGSLQIWPTRAVVNENMPQTFRSIYPKTRVILDCTEIKAQTPSSKVLNSESYSNYKSHITFKSLIGITPCGVVSFISTLFTGSISDKAITARSGILDLLEPGDEVMADKGFVIQDLLESKQATLVIPPFLGEKGQFSENDVKKTHDIARLRIHVERAIRRIKEFHIFDGVVPLNLVASINQIWTVCAILTNFRGPLF